MFAKLMVSGLMCLSLMVIGQPNAQALVFGGGGLKINSPLTCHSFGSGGGNLFKNPQEVQCTLDIHSVAVSCMNHGGGTGGLGQPFFVSTEVVGGDLLSPDQLTGKGQWFSEIVFSQQQIEEAVGELPLSVCQNQNWSVVPDSLTVVSTAVTLEGFKCAVVEGDICLEVEENPTDVLILECTLNSSQDGYNCVEIFHQKS